MIFQEKKKKKKNFQFEKPKDLFFTFILLKLTNTKLNRSENLKINKRNKLTFFSVYFYFIDPKTQKDSLHLSKIFSKEKKNLTLPFSIFIESYVQTSPWFCKAEQSSKAKFKMKSEKINWPYFSFEFKDEINSKDLRSLNLFLFNEFFDWSKNQHKNQPNSWIFKKYWLFVENNSTFSYTPVLSDFFEKELRVKKAHKLEGYLCLKRFFSNFSNLNLTKLRVDDSENQNQEKGKKKTNRNKAETYSLKKTKLHLKTWYLKKYKKKKLI